MKVHSHFPTVLHNFVNGRHEAVIGWELSSILVASLVLDDTRNKPEDAGENAVELLSRLFHYRVAFAQALSSWRETISLELNITTIPDIRFQPRGVVHYYLLMRAHGPSSEGATELILTRFTAMQALINSSFPECEFTPVRDREQLLNLCRPFQPAYVAALRRMQRHVRLAQPLDREPTGFTSQKVGRLHFAYEDPEILYTYPWTFNPESQERMIHYLLWQSHPVWIVIKVRPSKDTKRERQRLLDTIEACDAHLGGAIQSKTVHVLKVKHIQEQATHQLAALEEGGIDMAVMVFTPGPADPSLLATIGNSITRLTGRGVRRDALLGGFKSCPIELERALDPWWYPENDVYSLDEVAGAFRFPSPPSDEMPGLPVKCFKSAFACVPPDFAKQSDAMFIGINVHRGVRQPVHCRLQDRMRHMYVLGMTGVGKSAFLESQVLQDIQDGHGLCVVDPHGEMIESVLGKIPKSREEDVILIDPLDSEFPVGFNLLEWNTLPERDRIIDDLYVALDQMYDLRQAGGPIFENNFRNMMKLLMGNKPREGFKPTLLEFHGIYLHKDFREWLNQTMDDPLVADFIEELEMTGGEASLRNLAPYITSKLGRFINDTSLRRIVGQQHTPFCFRQIMDQGRILLINLRKGHFGHAVGGLLASQIVSRLKNAAMSRADSPERERRPFFCYVDEFQNLPQEEFTELLAEARKYRLGLVLANQFGGQLNPQQPGQRSALQAILGNVGIFVIFRVGTEDAQYLNAIFHPTFSTRDLKTIPNWQAYVQLRTEGKVLSPFSIETVLDGTPWNPQAAQRIRQLSREKYARSAEEVDESIMARRRFFEHSN